MSRLSWFPFYVDDFMGGTATMSAEDCGQYLLCLLGQWNSAELRAIPANAEELRILCRGTDPSRRVLRKFEPVEIEGEPYLRNRRLAGEWGKAHKEHTSKSLGAKHPRLFEDTYQDTTQDTRTQPQPQPQPDTTTKQTTNKRSTPSAASRRTEGHETWLTPYGSAWKERWGAESEPPYGQMAGTFRKPEETLGAEELVGRWKRYLAAQKDAKSARPRWFVEGLGQWKAPETPKPVLPAYMTEAGRRREREGRIRDGMPVDPPATPEETRSLRGDA